MLEGESLPQLYRDYVRYIHAHHPPRPNCQSDAPVGWCSWYAYYADVNEQHIRDNVDAMQGELDALEWVLLDDGYQAFMGDWLTPSTKFSAGVKQVVASIRQRGKKPAIWMAPFIAEPNSTVFRDHPEWFVRHADGTLLKAEDVTYGGWRCTPWYILDGSNPHVQEHLTQVVRTMREEWGIELFKLDANYWGTLKGKRYQAGVTGVEAYRMGMQAIIDGAQTARKRRGFWGVTPPCGRRWGWWMRCASRMTLSVIRIGSIKSPAKRFTAVGSIASCGKLIPIA